MAVKIDPKSKSREPEVFQGMLGKDITLGTKVVFTKYKSYNFHEGYIRKITDKNVYVDTGHGSWLRRRISKPQIKRQLISLEEEVDEVNSS